MVLDLGGLNLALMCHGIVSCCGKICLVSTTVKSGTRERRIATISVFSQRLSGSGHCNTMPCSNSPKTNSIGAIRGNQLFCCFEGVLNFACLCNLNSAIL